MGNRILQDYGIMPQAKGNKESFVDFMQRTTWFQAMTSALQRHSEFMRPELADGFPDMEYGYPDKPQDPPWLPPELRGPPDLTPNGACVISCYAPLYCNQPVKCHFSVSQTPPGMTPTEGLQNVQMTVWETTYNPKVTKRMSGDRMSMQSHQTDSAMDGIYRTQNSGEGGPSSGPDGRAAPMTRPHAGSIFPMEVWPPALGWPEWPASPSTKLKICAGDPSGNICCTNLSVFCRGVDCCTSADYIAMTFDDASTPDVVARAGSISLYVVNGCGNYQWTVSGTGFSLAGAETTTPTNTLSLADTACSAIGHAAKATITVTDKCGVVVAFRIKASDGAWDYVAGWSRTAACDQVAQCGGLKCALNGVNSTVYGVGGTGGAYDTKWDLRWIPGGCPSGSSDYTHTSASGACGGTSLTAAAAGFPGTPGACDCSGGLYYWTCGDDC